jgi:hypothetical protein
MYEMLYLIENMGITRKLFIFYDLPQEDHMKLY